MSIYHRIVVVWFKCTDVTLTATEERNIALMKCDLSGFLTAVSFMGNIMAAESRLATGHVIGVLAFFKLVKPS